MQITLKAHIIEASEKMCVMGRGRDGLRRGRVQRRQKDRRSKNCRRQINSQKLQVGVERREEELQRCAALPPLQFLSISPVHAPLYDLI